MWYIIYIVLCEKNFIKLNSSKNEIKKKKSLRWTISNNKSEQKLRRVLNRQPIFPKLCFIDKSIGHWVTWSGGHMTTIEHTKPRSKKENIFQYIIWKVILLSLRCCWWLFMNLLLSISSWSQDSMQIEDRSLKSHFDTNGEASRRKNLMRRSRWRKGKRCTE